MLKASRLFSPDTTAKRPTFSDNRPHWVWKRLNRGGNRDANHALWRVVMVRLVSDPVTRHYMERRTKEGKSKLETIRCLKRYVARELYPLLAQTPRCNR